MKAPFLCGLAISLALSGSASAQVVSPEDGFIYDWNDPTDLDDGAKAERDKFESEFGGIAERARAREAERKQAIAEYERAERELAEYRRNRLNDLFEGPDIGAAMLTGFAQGLEQSVSRIRREQEAKRRAQQRREYEALKSRVNYARKRAASSRRESASSTGQSRRESVGGLENSSSSASSISNSSASSRRSNSSGSGSSGLRIVDTNDSEPKRRERERRGRLFAEQKRKDILTRRAAEEKKAAGKRVQERVNAEANRAPLYYVCTASSNDNKPVRNYASGVIRSQLSAANSGPISQGFGQFLQQKYGESIRAGTCRHSEDRTVAVQRLHGAIDKYNNSEFRKGYNLQRYIETGWTGP